MKTFIYLFSALLMWVQSMNAQPNVEHLSMITTPVLLLKGNSIVSQGTGFYYALQDTAKNATVIFLVTNYHVLTGSAPSEKKPPIGDNIVFFFHKDEKNTGDLKEVRYPLFTRLGDPIWITSKTYPEADVAIIPLPSGAYQDCKVFGISEEWTKAPIKLRPSSRVTLVGYPYGYEDSVNALPIWKTGSIASEPNVDFSGKPLFVVDVSAFPGMSGSPVFAVSYGAYEMEQGGTTVGGVQKFLGIYASMEMLQEKKFLEELQSGKKEGIVITESLQLGHVWKAQLIIDMVKSINVPEYEEKILRNIQ
ncbi:MAG: serine protease [Bacteroidetes bacterium]|nr:serine protease [Bacteroidota bacterium]